MIGYSEKDGKLDQKYNELPRDKKERKCKFCGKKLSMYNLNDYCFIHVIVGIEARENEKELKRLAYRAKVQKNYVYKRKHKKTKVL